MKNIKEITISIFAVIGFVAIITGFTNNQAQPTTPESHVWTMHIGTVDGKVPRVYAINKVTGEVRKFDSYDVTTKGSGINTYVKMKELPLD